MLPKGITLVLVVCGATAAPTDGPVRIELEIPGASHRNLSFDSDSSAAGSSVRDSATVGVGAEGADRFQSYTSRVGLFEERPRTLESAILETESFDSKAKSITENFEGFVAGIFQPKPIVDTISEEEKYGNDGDKFAGVGRALVSGSESVANLLSRAVQFPVDFLKSITRKTSSSLNNLGSKLIGL